jgi:hypothetical protein
MIKLFCLGLLFFSFQLTQAQTYPAASPTARPVVNKNDDAIIVELTDTPEAGWRQLAQILMARGYSIEHSDKDLLTLSTYQLGYSRVAGMVKNKTMILRMYESVNEAAYNSQVQYGTPTQRVRRRDNTSGHWRELEAIARELGRITQYMTSPAQ